MNTPICDFVSSYAQKNGVRLHVPGHKGNSLLGIEKLDITEIFGADVLYISDGIIKESERNAAKLFGSKKTLYSAEGSSLSIRAMLFLVTLWAKSIGREPVIACARNAHKTFMTAASLIDFKTLWIFPEKSESLISCKIHPEKLDRFLSESTPKPVAVYITSPDYLGNISDISSLSAVCRRHGALLLVDNAHGAYLNFLPESKHPIALGADICCDSAHKTLPALTGAGYLHISKSAPDFFVQNACDALSLFASTSPSYLILQSLDMLNAHLDSNYRERLAQFVLRLEKLKKHLVSLGHTLVGDEALKITVSAKEYGYTGNALAQILRENNIECEFSDSDFLVMMFTPDISEDSIRHLEKTFAKIEKRKKISSAMPEILPPKVKLSPREALFSPYEILPSDKCLGKIFANLSLSCPPAIPVVVCGEEIGPNEIALLKYYGINECKVVKK